MNLYSKIFFLSVLVTTNGFAAGKMLIEYTASSKQFSRPISHMVEHHRTSQTIHSKPLVLDPNTSPRALGVHRLSWVNEHVRELRLKPIVTARHTPSIIETELLTSLIKAFHYPLNNPKKTPMRQAPRSRFDLANHLLHSQFSSSSPFCGVQKRFYSSNSGKGKDDEQYVITTPEVRMAYERIKLVNLPKEVIDENRRQDEEFEKYSRYTEHLKQQAEAQGEAKSKINIAKNLLNDGMDKKKVSKLTGLSLEELDKLQI